MSNPAYVVSAPGGVGVPHTIKNQLQNIIREAHRVLESNPSTNDLQTLVKDIKDATKFARDEFYATQHTKETREFLNGAVFELSKLINDANEKIAERIANETTPEEEKEQVEKLDEQTARVRSKIEKARVTNFCELKSFDEYSGGATWRKYFEAETVIPLTYEQVRNMLTKANGILLFGPPGTGKTYLVDSLAKELEPYGVGYFRISTSDIQGSYVGDAESAIKELFRMARKRTHNGTVPVIVFIDEIDGLIGRKEDTGILSQLNAELTAPGNTGIIFVTATNFPERLPDAILSRTPQRFSIGLPDYNAVLETLQGWFNTTIGEYKYNIKMKTDTGRDLYLQPDMLQKRSHTIFDDVQMMKNDGKSDSEIDTFFFSKCDILEFMAVEMVLKKFSQRDIDNVFKTMIKEAAYRSVHFVRALKPEGTDPSKEYAKVLDFLEIIQPISVKKFEHGRCTMEQVAENWSYVPLGVNVNDGTPFTIGTIKNKNLIPLMTNGIVARVVVVERTLENSVDANGKQRQIFRYKIIKTQRANFDEKEDFSLLTDEVPPRNLGTPSRRDGFGRKRRANYDLTSILDISQITYQDFEKAMEVSKTQPISNTYELIKFWQNNARNYDPNSYAFKSLVAICVGQEECADKLVAVNRQQA